MYTSLLVPLDGSPASEQVLPLARSIAARSGATLHLAHVHEPHEPIYVEGMPVIDEELQSRSREHERVYMQTMAERLAAEAGLPVKGEVLEGPVVPTLLRQSAAVKADMIVMTTHGHGGLARAWLGSVADALVRQSSVPVLLFRPQAGLAQGTPTFDHILIPLDGSPLAEQALEPARTFGTTMGSRYTLVQIVPPFELGGYVPGVDAAQLDREIRQRRHDEAKTYLERIAERLRAEGATVTTRVGFAKQAAVGVLDVATEYDADVIALATHGRSGLRRLLLGSIADKVVRSADMPVLLYHPHNAE